MKQVALLFFIAGFLGFGQEVTKLQEYLPPSPTAQEFIKYGEYPVSMSTGVPNISISIYNIEAKDINVPIALGYHASGIQVDRMATWAGLGWSLQVGGTISKVPRGTPDDEPSFGFLNVSLPEYEDLVFDDNFYEGVATGVRDTESDVYHYNVGGYSGKFIFDRQKNIQLIEAHPIKITYNSGNFILIDKGGTTYEFNDREYTRTLTNGADNDHYYVSTWHLSKILSKNKTEIVDFQYGSSPSFTTNQYSYGESTGTGFQYNQNGCPYIENNVHNTGQLSSHTGTTHTPLRLEEITFPDGRVSFARVESRQDMANGRLTDIKIYQKQDNGYAELKSFELVHGYFFSSQTTFYPPIPTDANRYRLRLDELLEKTPDGSPEPVVKKHTFEYNAMELPPLETNAKDYWGYYNGKNTNQTLIPLQDETYLGNPIGNADREPDPQFIRAGVLEKITYPTGGSTVFTFAPHTYQSSEFEEVSRTANVSAVGISGAHGNTPYMEQTVTITPNKGGYANLSLQATDMNDAIGTFPMVTLQKQGDSGYLIHHTVDPYTYTFPLNPPLLQQQFDPVLLEKDVSYVLKVKVQGTSFSSDYGGAAFISAQLNYNEIAENATYMTKYTGGLRVEKITSYDYTGAFAFSKEYAYDNGTLITNESFLNEQYLDKDIEDCRLCGSGGTYGIVCASTTRRFYYGGTVRTLTLEGGSPMIYPKVREYTVDDQGNNTGWTDYNFHTQQDFVLPVPYAYQGGLMILKKEWEGGQQYYSAHYGSGSVGPNDYIVSESTGYATKRYDDSYNMYKIVHKKNFSGDYAVSPANEFSRYEVFEYPIFQGIKLPATYTNVNRSSSGEVVTMTRHFYENDIHLQPTRTEKVNSDGKRTVTTTFYPDDIENIDTMGAAALTVSQKQIVDAMKAGASHRVAEPIQVHTLVEDANGNTLSESLHRTNYKDWGANAANTENIVLPESIVTLKGVYSATENPMEDRIIYHDYDDRGNPIKVSVADGPMIYYLWGYDKQYPIAKLENITDQKIADIQALINVAVTASDMDDDNCRASHCKEQELRGALGDIRNHTSMSASMVTTYTYDPLVGVTGMTDPRGYTTYYEYDYFNRLEFVKDADGNIVSENQYHYKNQQ